MTNLKSKTEDYWKKKLTPDQYNILRQKGTEMPYSGSLLDNNKSGTYNCVACGHPLFSSDTKFDSGTGWPSFTDPINRENILLEKDESYGMQRMEVKCRSCGSHLGHLFENIPIKSLTGKTKLINEFCINSACLNFIEK